MKYLIINGPNLNLLGMREVNIYGTKTYQDLKRFLKDSAKQLQVKIKVVQTNSEGKIVTLLQKANHKYDGVILNAAAYTHYSYAIYDAIKAINIPVIEVHLSDITTREDFRKKSVIKDACANSFYGEGFLSYQKALQYLKERGNNYDY